MFAKYENLPINSLFIDPAYQRGINHARVKEWSKNFDESLIGTIEVAKRSNGTYAILDGQHRWHLLKSKGHKKVPCLVHHAMSIQEEALKFKELNANKNKLSELEKFWAMIGARSPKHLEILATIRKNGLEVAQKSQGAKGNLISAIGKIMYIERIYGIPTLDNALSFIVNVWPGNGYSLKGLIVEGIAVFLHRHAHTSVFNPANAKKKLALLDTEIVLARARDKFKLHGSGIPYNIADILCENYNKGLSAEKKLSWTSREKTGQA